MKVVGNADLGSTFMIGLGVMIFYVNLLYHIVQKLFMFIFAWFLHAFQSKSKEMKPRQDSFQDKSGIEIL